MSNSSRRSGAPAILFASLNRYSRTTGFLLTALYGAVFVLSVGVLFGFVYWQATKEVGVQIRERVTQEANLLLGIDRAAGTDGMADAITRRIAIGRPSGFHYALLDRTGRQMTGDLTAGGLAPDLSRPPPEPEPRLPGPRPPGVSGRPPQAGPRSPGRVEFRELHVADGQGDDSPTIPAQGRRLPGGETLYVGYDGRRAGEFRDAIVQAFGWAMGLAILLAVGGGAVISLRFLGRIDAINATMRKVMHGDLGVRAATRGTGDELDSLAVGLNVMLDRLGELMDGIRQVSSDIAHDLRTPLAKLRQRLETIQAKGETVEDYRAAVIAAIADSDAILQTFSALLRIAQIEGGARLGGLHGVSLSEIGASMAEAYQAVAEEGGRSLSASIESGVSVEGDRDLLVQMCANLVENAIRHTPPGSRIEIAVGRRDGGPEIAVSDDGPGIPDAEKPRVLGRFYRLEHSRTTPGNGLGLALVKAVAELHGAALALADNRPGLRVTVAFRPRP